MTTNNEAQFFCLFCELVNKVQFSQTPDWCQLYGKIVINKLSISERSQEKLLELLLELIGQLQVILIYQSKIQRQMYKKKSFLFHLVKVSKKLFKLHILAVLSISMVSMETSKVFLSGDITKRGSLLIEHARHSPSRSKCIVRNKTDERGYSISFYNSSRRPKGENKQPNLVVQ